MSDGQRRYAIDFHVHTSHSFDSLTPPKMAIEIARRRGLDGIAVTDHDTISGAVAAAEANRYSDFLVIPGIEVKSDRGDIIGLYLKRDIKSRTFADVIDEIHEQGGVAYLPHPIRTFGAAAVPEILAGYPGIDRWELYNGRYDRAETAAARAAFTQLSIAHPLCGSDAHFPWEIGLFRARFSELPRDARTLLAASTPALHAPPRSDLAVRGGIRLGATVKRIKRRDYAGLAPLLISLPWRALRLSARAALERGRGPSAR